MKIPRKISKATCNRCGEKIIGEEQYLTYHTYKVHPGVLEAGFDEDYAKLPNFLKKLYTKEEAFAMVMREMKEIEEREEKLR